MTGYISQPIEPFYVPAKVLKPLSYAEPSDASKGAATRNDASSSSGMWGQFDNANSWSVRVVAAAIFALLYILSDRDPGCSALSVIALLLCTLLRLDDYKRKVAQVPLTLAALMLVRQITARVVDFRVAVGVIGTNHTIDNSWIPLFFAVCLFYMPNGHNFTRKVLLSISVLLLASGLLPMGGFVAIFTTVQYMLFLAIVAGLGMDFMNSHSRQREKVLQ